MCLIKMYSFKISSNQAQPENGLALFNVGTPTGLQDTISFFFGKDQARADEEKAFEKTNLSALKYRPNKRKEGGPILSNSRFCISHSSDTWTSLPANASLCVR